MATLRNPDCPLSCASLEEAGVVWFTALGFRPAVWTPPHRNDHVDPARLVPAPDADEPYSKYDLPVTLDAPTEGHGFGFVIWPGDAMQITAASLAGIMPGPIFASISPGVFTLFPPVSICCDKGTPGTVVVPPVDQPAQVDIEASSATLLLAGIGFLFGRRIWTAMGRLGAWFTAERGTGPHQNGWV